MPVGDQVSILYCGTHALMKDIPLEKVRDFQTTFLDRMHAGHEEDVLKPLAAGKINEEIENTIKEVAESVSVLYKA